MLRKLLLPAAALLALGGCVTGYGYRSGNGGDYYYGQPQVEYRHVGPYGAIGGYYGGMRPIAYYDRFGRLVYGYPYGPGYYGSPYYGYYGSPYYGSPYHGHPHPYPPGPRVPYSPRPGDSHPPPDPGHDPDRNDRKPPWRDFGRLQPRQDEPGALAEPLRTRPLREDSASAAALRPSFHAAPAGRMEPRRQLLRDPAQAESLTRSALPNEVREVE